jgi:hypothetical protein
MDAAVVIVTAVIAETDIAASATVVFSGVVEVALQKFMRAVSLLLP